MTNTAIDSHLIPVDKKGMSLRKGGCTFRTKLTIPDPSARGERAQHFRSVNADSLLTRKRGFTLWVTDEGAAARADDTEYQAGSNAEE